MNDLNVIADQNAKAVEAAIPQQQAAGKYVVAQYTGLHFVDFTSHDTLRDCNQAATEWTNKGPSHRTVVHNPIN